MIKILIEKDKNNRYTGVYLVIEAEAGGTKTLIHTEGGANVESLANARKFAEDYNKREFDGAAKIEEV